MQFITENQAKIIENKKVSYLYKKQKNKKIKRQNQYQREDGPNNRWKEGWIDQMTEKLIELYVCSLQAKLQNLKYGLRANLHAR